MGKDAFPATPGERCGKVCFVWGLVVAEPDLGWKITITRECKISHESTHIAVDAMDHILWWQVRDLWVGLGNIVRENFNERLPFLLGLSEHRL